MLCNLRKGWDAEVAKQEQISKNLVKKRLKHNFVEADLNFSQNYILFTFSGRAAVLGQTSLIGIN